MWRGNYSRIFSRHPVDIFAPSGIAGFTILYKRTNSGFHIRVVSAAGHAPDRGGGSGNIVSMLLRNRSRVSVPLINMAAPSRAGRGVLRSSTALVVCGVLSAGLLDGGLAAHAQQRWDGDGSSDWGTAGNWDGGGVPVSSSNVRIDASGSTFQPTIVDARTIRSLDMRSGTLSISGTAASLAVDSFLVAVPLM